MNRQEYIDALQQRMQSILDDYLFNNYKNQIIARKLSADFSPTYKEPYLWNRALFLSSSGCKLLNESSHERTAIRAIKESAEIFENFSLVSGAYDREYCIILAALCYDLSGYQANALCLIKTSQDYIFTTEETEIELSPDNYILSQIRLILLKSIPNARASLANQQNNVGIVLFNQALSTWYDSILNGVEDNFTAAIDKSYQFYSNDFNIHVSHLLYLLKARMLIYQKRSIWNNLRSADFIRESTVWTKYIKLLSYDAYDRNLIKPVEKRVSKFEFWTSQLRAVEKGLLTDNSNFVVQMPTSAGKTFIAELAIIDSLAKHPNKKCLYVAPFRALTNEKEEELATIISKLGYSVSALSGSYELDEFQEIVLEDTDVLIATPEKMDFLYRQNPDYFNQVSLIVVDEGHIVGDISQRASLLEFLLIRLKIKVQALKTLFISAVMPPDNADEYSIWLNGVSDKVIRSLLHNNSSTVEEWEPTRKLIGSFEWSGTNGVITFKNISTENEETRASTAAFVPAVIRKRQFGNQYPNGDNKAQTSASLAFERSKDGNCLIFCAQVRDTERVGDALLNILDVLEADQQELPPHFSRNTETESYFFARKWYGDISYVTRCIERGIGVHYGDMPEAVRRSVESDYASGNLRILISTNTVGQGLNFPIKHLIIHSTIISNGVYVGVRDFWNIIGRAGRAGKETEGEIIFVIKSPTDKRSYDRYTDKSKIEAAYSMFLTVLKALLRNRISNATYERYMEVISESYLMNLLAEETVETEDQDQIELIISNSLFKVQADRQEIDLQPVRQSFTTIFKNIRETVPPELLQVFGQTGFTLSSNQAISTFIDTNLEVIRELIARDDYLEFLKLVLVLFSEGNIEEVTSEKINAIGKSHSEFYAIAKSWIEVKEINQIQEEWRDISDNPNRLNILISDGFYYRYTWGITAFTTILISKFAISREELPEGIKNLPSYIKYGVNNATACLARSLAIKNRDVSVILAEQSGGLSGREFIKWLANLTIEDIQGYNLNVYDRNNVLSVATKLTTRRYNEIPTSFEFLIKGTFFEDIRKATSRIVNVGDVLISQRENNNQFDPYAIKLFFNENELGYVPREYSRLISVEMDINNSEYETQVLNVTQNEDYNSIYVQMTKR